MQFRRTPLSKQPCYTNLDLRYLLCRRRTPGSCKVLEHLVPLLLGAHDTLLQLLQGQQNICRLEFFFLIERSKKLSTLKQEGIESKK